MKTYLILAALCLLCIVQLYDHQANPASSADVAALVGGKQCYYPNEILCDNRLSEVDCDVPCDWDDYWAEDPEDPLWGKSGSYSCPEGFEFDIQELTLSTTIKTADRQDLGWHTDQEKANAEDCNTKYVCACERSPAPAWIDPEDWPFCLPEGDALPVPQATLREVTGPNTCDTSET